MAGTVAMSTEPLPWKILTLVATLLTIAVPAYVAYDVYYRGPSAEKHIRLMNFPPIDPLADLSRMADRPTLVTAKGETLNNLVIARAYFHNAGRAPVLPEDYDRNLEASVSAPWKIVAVQNGANQRVQLNWRRVSDTKFEADPALPNPGDEFITLVYLTNTEFGNTFASRQTTIPAVSWNARTIPAVSWDARIVNLPDFSRVPFVYDTAAQYFQPFPPIIILLSGWAVPFAIVVAILFQALYLHLLDQSGWVRDWSWKSIGLVVCTGLLSVAAAECIATYVFGTPSSAFTGVESWVNAPPIILHAMFLAFLWWKARARVEKARLAAG
jgi:hypothetical protein